MTVVRLALEKDQITQHILRLQALLQTLDLSATVYEFPTWTVEDIGQEPQAIAVTPVHGQRAVELAMLHMRHFQREFEQPGVFAKRLAGHLLVQCSAQVEVDIRQRVAIINEMKEDFHRLVLSLGKNVNTRFEQVRLQLPDLSKISISRQLLLAKPNLTNLTYSWAHRTTGGFLTYDDLVQQNKVAQQSFSKTFKTRDEWEAQLKVELDMIMRYKPSDVFIQRRPTRIAPIAKLTHRTGEERTQTTSHTHSPIMIINAAPKIGVLKPYLAKPKSKVDDASREVILRKHIYLATDEEKARYLDKVNGKKENRADGHVPTRTVKSPVPTTERPEF